MVISSPSSVGQSPDEPLGWQREVLEEEIVKNWSERRADIQVILDPLALVLQKGSFNMLHHCPANFWRGILRVVFRMTSMQIFADGGCVLAPLDEAASLRQRTHVVGAHMQLALVGAGVAQQHAIHDGEHLLHHGVQM